MYLTQQCIWITNRCIICY